MQIVWICRNCGQRLAQVSIPKNDPRVAALTSQAGDDIIEINGDGNLHLHILCEDCLETIYPEEDSEIVFLRGPELH